MLYIYTTSKPEYIMRTITKEAQQKITPDKAIQILKEGNQRFVNNLKANRNLLQQVNETSDGQFPFAVILSCIDSRTSAELIFDQGLGDIFSIRVAGNILNTDILGSMEFACKVAGSKLVLVLGHTRCGAISGACKHVELGNLTGLLQKVKPAMDKVEESLSGKAPDASDSDYVQAVTEENVRLTLARIRKESSILAEMEQQGQIRIVGGLYDVETGEVNIYEK
jgi:carbonic anhydrase